MYVYRNITPKVLELIHNFPVVGIIGPRQVGKTTLVKELISSIDKPCIYLDLELPEDFSKLHDPQIYLEQHEEKCVILDEIQRMPNVFSILRALVDRRRDRGRFVILGSASPDLLKQSSETLADRIVYNELSPFNLMEIKKDHNMTDHWFKGGFPEAFLSDKSNIFTTWMRNFVQTYLERDLVFVGGTEPKACIEIKYTSQPKLSKGFRTAVDDLKTQNNFIITPQSDTYPISKSNLVCNLADFLSKHLAQIR